MKGCLFFHLNNYGKSFNCQIISKIEQWDYLLDLYVQERIEGGSRLSTSYFMFNDKRCLVICVFITWCILTYAKY